MNAFAIGYLGIGAIIGIAVCVHFVRERYSDSFQASIRRAFSNSRPVSTWTFAVKLLGALLFCVFFWLVFLGWVLTSLLLKGFSERGARESAPPGARSTFLARKEALVTRMSIDEIEAREVVNDPAGGAPSVAFGYLSDTWSAFKQQIRPGDELWLFELNKSHPPEEDSGQDAVSSGGGYALMRDGEVFAEFVAHADDATAWAVGVLRESRQTSSRN